MKRNKRKILSTIIGLIIFPMIGVRAYREFVHHGASFEPFVGYSNELPAIISPNGESFRLFVNDAGAMHSGNHWTWVVDRHWLTGKYVVVEGYITAEYANGDSELVVNWENEKPILEFAADRY